MSAKSLTEIKRWLMLRCAHCGHRFRWSRDARHSFGNRDGKVYHRPCLERIMWRSKAEERLAILDLVTDIAGLNSLTIEGVVENRSDRLSAPRTALSNQSFRVFRDLSKLRADVDREGEQR